MTPLCGAVENASSVHQSSEKLTVLLTPLWRLFKLQKVLIFLTHNKTNRYKNFLEATAKKFEAGKWKNFYTVESVTLLSQFRVRMSRRTWM
jgi:hypothetical protein